MENLIFFGLIFTALVLQVQGSLTLRKQCGDIECQEYEYCSAIDHICRPCSRICDSTSNNFDENRCEQECQDHIHDQRYMKNGNGTVTEFHTTKMYRDLQQDIQTLKILVGISVGLTAICLIAVIFVFIVFVKRFGGGKSSEKSKSLELRDNYNNANKYNGSDVSSTNQSLKSPSTLGLGNNNSVAPMKYDGAALPPTLSQRILREPSESTLPEYAYDNASLSPTSHHV